MDRAKKVYTKTGDKGETSLIGGARVKKNNPQIEAYGSIDELNSTIGLIISHLEDREGEIGQMLLSIQHHLFDIGAELANDTKKKTKVIKVPKVTKRKIERLEKQIDTLSKALSPIRTFILPGGTKLASFCHLARTVTRRAERRIVELNETRPLNPKLVAYLNRLSDLFFVLARYFNHRAKSPDITWQKDT